MCFNGSMTTTSTDSSNTFDHLWHSPASTRGWYHAAGHQFHMQDCGRCTLLSLRHVPGLGVVGTIHEEGKSYWSSRGARSYGPAQVHTVLFDPNVQNAPNANHFKYVLLASAPVGEYNSASARTDRDANMVAMLRQVGV